MVYRSEIKHRKMNSLQPRYLQNFNERRQLSLRRILLPYCKEYCTNASIHGFRYLTDTKMQKFEKAIWLLIIAATTFGAVYVYVQLAELYFTQRIQTTVADSVHPIFYIPFPSIAICTRNRVDWTKLPDAQKRFLHANATPKTVDTFRRFFGSLEDLRFGKFSNLARNFDYESAAEQRLSLIDGVNVLEVMRYLNFNCADIFENTCLWRKRVYNCCELFVIERTEYGFCHVFNSAIGEVQRERMKRDKYYPYHNSKSGESSGLEVDVNLDESKMRPDFKATNGVYVMVKQTEQWHSDPRFVNYNTYTKIAITAQLTEVDSGARTVSPDERQCLFEDEFNHPMYKKIPGLIYWRGNCHTRCHQEYIIKYCNCNLSIFFPNSTKSDNFTDCRPSDYECIYEHEKIFSSERYQYESDFVDNVGDDSMVCNCLNSCTQLLFDCFFTSVALEGVSVTDSIKKVHLDIHFQSNYFLKYSTRMRYSYVELLANFGGIIGLFLGASLLSAVELTYYFTIGLYAHMRKQYNFSCRKKNVKVVQVKYTHQNLKKILNESRKY